MEVLTAKYILTFDEANPIITDGAVAFEKQIVQTGKKEEILKKYPDAKVYNFDENSCLMPGLINSHIHLEYLANKTTLEYGEFVMWLKSVIKYKEQLTNQCSDKAINEACDMLLECGTTTIGEISSFGMDIQALKNSKINVMLFNEVLGSNPSAVDITYQDFLQRYQMTLSLEDERFIPAISIHSPYSTHPILAKKALGIAKEKKHTVATHFMESFAEREWLDKSKGNFEEFLKAFNPYASALTTPKEYLKLFDGIKTLFIHATYANDDEIEYINNQNQHIVTCPVSNRLLENKRLNIDKVKNLCLATDGLTSNISLNLWDELRATLFIHEDKQINTLSKDLLKSVTKTAGKALGLNKGVLKNGFDADMIVVKLAGRFDNIESIYKWLILHTKTVEKSFILGNEV